ncbi:MAG: hypothetical protein ACKVWR_06940 [Acidimicrobiales bacterium]
MTTTSNFPHRAHVVAVSSGTGRTWRNPHQVALMCLMAYSTALGWQAQLVSYPLYRAVGAADFAAYHARYKEAIPWVVVVPGFVCFLAGAAFPWTRPRAVSLAAAALVSVASLTALLSTVAWAIPAHDKLDRAGQSAATIDRLLQANLLRSGALTVGMLTLAACVVRQINRNSAAPES